MEVGLVIEWLNKIMFLSRMLSFVQYLTTWKNKNFIQMFLIYFCVFQCEIKNVSFMIIFNRCKNKKEPDFNACCRSVDLKKSLNRNSFLDWYEALIDNLTTLWNPRVLLILNNQKIVVLRHLKEIFLAKYYYYDIL